jgi:hypothetical protein
MKPRTLSRRCKSGCSGRRRRLSPNRPPRPARVPRRRKCPATWAGRPGRSRGTAGGPTDRVGKRVEHEAQRGPGVEAGTADHEAVSRGRSRFPCPCILARLPRHPLRREPR